MLWIDGLVRAWRHQSFVQNNLDNRLPVVRAALSTEAAKSILLVGNSHAEFLGTPDFSGRPSVNLGIGGSTAGDCADQLVTLRASLSIPPHASAAVLFIGTNDILRWRRPERLRTIHRFEDDVETVLKILAGWSRHVFVAAIPPIAAWVTNRDPVAVTPFNACLKTLCTAGGHTFFDPFPALSERALSLDRGMFHRDGVHMADYEALAAEVVQFVVPHLARPHHDASQAVVAPPVSIERCKRSASGRTFGQTVRAAGHRRRPPSAPNART